MNANKNPLNIKGRDHWLGKIANDSRGHCIFESPEYGIRAGMRTLQSKWINCKRTIAAIISEWAPSSDTQGSMPGRPANDPDDYAGYVARRAGIGEHAALPDPVGCDPVWGKIIAAMAHYEMGTDCPPEVIERGMELWKEDFVDKHRE